MRTACLLIVLCASPLLAQFAEHPVNQWVKQSPREGKPTPRFGWEGSAAWDPYNRLWIHHAGHDGVPQGFVTFTLDPANGTWQQKFPPTSPPGVCCVDGANVFDPANRVFVRFPGGSLGHGFQWSRGVKLKESAVWVYDAKANMWTNMRPAPYGEGEKYSKQKIGGLNPNGTYDPIHELAISFGGQGAGGGKDNLHAYDAYANRLYLMNPKETPGPRDGVGIAYDAKHNKLVLFGGQYTEDERTWLYDFATNKWEAHDLTPRPLGKKLGTYSTIPKMTYDSVNGVVLCVVWLDKGGHETWALDVGKMTWTKTGATAEPEQSKSRSRNLDFSADDNLAIMETWTEKGEPQVWTYRYKAGPTPAPHPQLMVTTTDSSAQLEWTPVKDAQSYNIYRGESAEPWNITFTKIASATDPRYEDKIDAFKSFVYTIRPVIAGVEGAPSWRARTEPRAPAAPTVAVLSSGKLEITWPAHSQKDVVAYNVYRAAVTPRVVKKGTPGAWKDNDPEYEHAQVVGVQSMTDFVKLNDKPLAASTFSDTVDLTKPAGEYRFGAYAYILRAVNRLGVESGPSPYALTIPAEPTNVLCRENGKSAELKWDAQKHAAGYHVYRLEGTWAIKRVTESPINETTFTHTPGGSQTRYWIVAVDAIGQEGQPSSPAWFGKSYKGFFDGDWHQ